MNLKTLVEGAKIAKKLGVKYLPRILTGLGIVAMGKATIDAIKVAPGARDALREIEDDPDLSHKEYLKAKAKVIAKAYGPIALESVGGAVCIAGGLGVEIKRHVRDVGLLTAMLSESKELNQKLENKIEEKFGSKKLNDIKDEITQENVRSKAAGLDLSTVYNTGKGNSLIYVMYWGFCLSDISFIESATQECNYDICERMQRGKESVVSLNDYFEYINLPALNGKVKGKDEKNVSLGPNLGKDLGWRNRIIKLKKTAMLLDGDQTCIAIGFADDCGPRIDPDISDDYGSDYIDDETDMPWRGR